MLIDIFYHIGSNGTLQVIPLVKYRYDIIKEAHDGKLGGHLCDVKVFGQINVPNHCDSYLPLISNISFSLYVSLCKSTQVHMTYPTNNNITVDCLCNGTAKFKIFIK